jgi:hypothetical protein
MRIDLLEGAPSWHACLPFHLELHLLKLIGML